MKRLTRTLLVGALILAVVAVSAAPAGAKQGGTDRPYKSSADGISNLEAPDDCDLAFPDLVCDQDISLDVIATHLGRGSSTSTGQITIHLDQPCFTPDVADGFIFDVAQVGTTVAANGDELFITTSASGCGDGVSRTEVAGFYTITGGTGRFAGAEGEGTSTAIALGSALSINLTGTISY